jgi:NAD(P)-dependent dehydrogenase (short-subunit alcohol dehydrogenase family)
VLDINTNGVLFTAQAAGRQMAKYKRPGSIILIASMSGSITNRVGSFMADTTASSVYLVVRTMPGSRITPASRRFYRWLAVWHANLGRSAFASTPFLQGTFIQSSWLSYLYDRQISKSVSDSMTAAYLDKQPHLLEKWSTMNPLGRLGRPDELRGVIAWLASDASSFCTGSE